MNQSAKPSSLERVTGNVATEVALTGLAAYVGGPLLALIPPLAKSLAAGRQAARVEAALAEVAETLQRHSAAIASLSDEQYQVIGDAISTMLQTTHEEKLAMLRVVVKNTLNSTFETPGESTVLSRIIRDVSPEEVEFIVRTFSADGVMIFSSPENEAKPKDRVYRVAPDSRDVIAISGLLSLGLLVPASSAYGGASVMDFTPMAAKLLALVRRDA